MKMKNYLIGFIILMVSIIPISNANALIGNNGIEYLEPPEGVERFVIYKRKDNTLRLIAIGNDTQYIASDYWNTNIGSSSVQSTSLYFYKVPVSTGNNVGCQDYDQTICTTNYGSSNYSLDLKVYDYSNNTWTLRNASLPNSFGTVTQLLYSTENIYLRTDNDYANYPSSSYLIPISVNNERTKTGLDRAYEFLTYESDIKSNIEYLSYEYDIKQTEDGNYSYYDIRLFSNNYNSDYEYLVKFGDEPFQNITSYLSDDSDINYQIFNNDTMYLLVRNEMRETIFTKTMTFTGITDIEEYDKPTIDINISCGTDFNSNIERALIDLKFNNYSTNYKYQYSFNNIDFVDISYEDIKNKKYTITTYLNTSIFVRVLDKNNNIVFENNNVVKCILNDKENKTYTYELSLDDLYDKENHKLIFYTFYYENSNFSENRDFKPYIYFFYTGNEKLDFHITYNTNAIDLPKYNESLMTKTLNDLPCTSLPFEYVDNTIFNNNYTSYTIFSFMPCIDLSTFLYNDQYQDFKLIIKSNIKLDIGEPISFGGNFIPSTNKPLDESDSFQTNYKSFFKTFTDSFNRFKNVIIEIFQNCTYFFSIVSPILQDFYITIFVLILFIFLIRFIL